MRFTTQFNLAAKTSQSAWNAQGILLQRKCASCGNHTMVGGNCEECEKKRGLLQRKSSGRSELSEAPPIVHEVLSSPGQPLDAETRAFFEPRFGCDFSDVRVHTDSRALQSARAMNALAYTVGQDVVFDAGQHAPLTMVGQRLLAHELAHTIQQRTYTPTSQTSLAIIGERDSSEIAAEQAADSVLRDGRVQHLSGKSVNVQRYASCGTPEECPPRVTGEIRRANRGPMIIREVSNGIGGTLVGNFAIGGSALKSDLRRDTTWREFKRQMAGVADVQWEILGFTDCQGSNTLNERLRRERAQALFEDLPQAAKDSVVATGPAPMSDCIAENTDEQGRSFNRSAFVRRAATTINFFDEEVEDVSLTNCSSPVVASTIDEYISLVICAEKALPSHTPRQMLSLLRQLYYSGQTWSRCRGAGCRFWSDVIPCGISISTPESALGTPLFGALRNSQVVGGIDIGHVFTGLESMFCPRSSVNLNVAGPNWTIDISNFEFATWAGDLGSAVAQKIHDEQDNSMPTQPWSNYFLTSGSLASEEDLIGDIDAYVLRTGLSGASCQNSPSKALSSLPGSVSQVLADYYINSSTGSEASQSKRFACFVKALGGSVAGRRIVGDRGRLTERLRIRIHEFGEKFYKLKWHSGYFAIGGIGSWFVAYGYDLARRFLDWVERKL